jgi:glycerophosphoryl diester phosphodiesterase
MWSCYLYSLLIVLYDESTSFSWLKQHSRVSYSLRATLNNPWDTETNPVAKDALVDNSKSIRIAHRGHSISNIDNSAAAFQSAVEEGFHMLELDLRLCKSGEIVIYHDAWYDDLLIEDLDLAEVKRMNQAILSLDEFFALDFRAGDGSAWGEGVQVYLDLKGSLSLSLALANYFAEHGSCQLRDEDIFIASFNRKHLESFRAATLAAGRPEPQLGWITANNFCTDEMASLLTRIPLHFVAFEHGVLDAETIELCRAHHVKVFAWTQSNPSVAKILSQFKLDGIVSDYVYWK